MLLADPVVDAAAAFARSRMLRLGSSHGWDHVMRVIAMADHIARIEGADRLIVHLSAILHDIGREEEDASSGGICHAEKGSLLAGEFLQGQGMDDVVVRRISLCIREHRYRNNLAPSSLESKVLYDADKLDSIGAIGIGRAFLFSGEIGARLHHECVDIADTSAYSAEDTAYREFYVKLRFVKDTMQTPEGRRLADDRHAFMEYFFQRLHRETKTLG